MIFEYDGAELLDLDGLVDEAEKNALVKEFIEDVAEYAADRFRAHVPVGETGRTLESVSSSRAERIMGSDAFVARAGVGPIPEGDLKDGEDPEYPWHVHEGTGLFGPRGAWIEPAAGNVMVFDVDSGSRTIFTRNVAGQPAQPYLQEVEEETHAYIAGRKLELAAAINALVSKR